MQNHTPALISLLPFGTDCGTACVPSTPAETLSEAWSCHGCAQEGSTPAKQAKAEKTQSHGSVADAVAAEARALGARGASAAAAGGGGDSDDDNDNAAQRAGTELLAPMGSAKAAVLGGFKALGLNDWLVRSPPTPPPAPCAAGAAWFFSSPRAAAARTPRRLMYLLHCRWQISRR